MPEDPADFGRQLGVSVVQAYLEGMRVRQEREAQQGLLQQRREEMMQEAQQFEENLKVKQDELSIREKLAKSLAGVREAQNTLGFLKAAKAGQTMLVQDPITGQHYIPRSITGGTDLYVTNDEALEFQARSILSEGTAKSTVAGMTAEKVAEARQPFLTDLLESRGAIAAQAQRQGQIYKLEAMEQQQKDRIAMRAVMSSDARTLLGLKQKGDLDLAHVRGAYQVASAGIRKAGGKEGEEELSPEVIARAVEHAATGVVNTTDLSRVVGAKNVPKVYAEMNKMRLAPLNQKQIDNLEALKMVSRVGTIFKAMNDIIQTKGRGAFTDPRYAALKDEVKQVAPLVRGLVKNAGAFSNQDADRAEGGAPSLNDGPLNTFSRTASQHKTDSFLTLVNDRRKSIMGRLSIRHQQMLEKAYDLIPDPDIDPANFK